MSYSLTISAFRFDAKTDFLPYYKRYEIEADADAALADVLELIKKSDKSFSYPENKYLGIKINGVATYANTPLSYIVKKFNSTELVLEPLSEFYAIKDLVIDISDFKAKMKLLKPFMAEGDEEYYEELVSYHYISSTLEYERGYYGDAMMMFAVFLIKKYPEKREQILKIIANKEYGIWLHTSIRNSIFSAQNATNIEKNIAQLKREVLKYVPDANSITKREAVNARDIKG